MDKSKKLALMDNREQIVSLALGGKHPKEIAAILDLNEVTVKKHLDEALELAKENYHEYTAKLLIKTSMRVEKLLDRLMEKFENLADKGDEFIDLSVVDRIDKLLNTQIKLAQRNQTIKVQHENDPNNPIGNQVVFYGGLEYERALEMAQANPEFIIIDPKQEQFNKYLDESTESA